jgi:hypothetical protein
MFFLHPYHLLWTESQDVAGCGCWHGEKNYGLRNDLVSLTFSMSNLTGHFFFFLHPPTRRMTYHNPKGPRGTHGSCIAPPYALQGYPGQPDENHAREEKPEPDSFYGRSRYYLSR